MHVRLERGADFLYGTYAMRKSVRRTLFYSMTAAFVVVTPIVVLYAVGYGVDLTERSLTRTGGFFVKTNVTGITVFVDDERKVETNFITRGALIAGLPPGLYAVRIEKERYIPWRKSIEIQEQVIQEFRSAVLVPAELQPTTVFEAATSTLGNPIALIPSPNGSPILLATEDTGKSLIWLIQKEGVARLLLSRKRETFRSATWNAAGDQALIEHRSGASRTWSMFSGETNTVQPLFPNPVIRFTGRTATSTGTLSRAAVKEVHLDENERWYVLASSTVYQWEQDTNTARTVLENIHSFSPLEGKLLFVTESGFIAESSLEGTEIQILDRPGFFMDNVPFSFMKSQTGIRAILDSAGGLYVENTELKRFIPSQGSARAKLAKSRDVLASSVGSILQTVILADETRQPFRKRYTKSRVIDAVVPIADFIWLGEDATHIVFTTEKGVFLTEEDARFGSNTVTLRTGAYRIATVPGSPNSFYLANDKAVERISIE